MPEHTRVSSAFELVSFYVDLGVPHSQKDAQVLMLAKGLLLARFLCAKVDVPTLALKGAERIEMRPFSVLYNNTIPMYYRFYDREIGLYPLKKNFSQKPSPQTVPREVLYRTEGRSELTPVAHPIGIPFMPLYRRRLRNGKTEYILVGPFCLAPTVV